MTLGNSRYFLRPSRAETPNKNNIEVIAYQVGPVGMSESAWFMQVQLRSTCSLPLVM